MSAQPQDSPIKHDVNVSGTAPPRGSHMPFPLRNSGPSKEYCSEDESANHASIQRAAASVTQTSFQEQPTSKVATLRGGSSNNLSGLVSNVYRTTGREPPGLVGASTTISGDKLYVFGGRRLRPQRLTNTLYELDLIRRHWSKIETTGDVPPPRFFHSVCALGDTKLVCFGGMALVNLLDTNDQSSASNSEPSMTVTSDIYVYDISTRVWTALPIPAAESPVRRYAHCATILPSSAVFSSASAPLSALRHNPPSNVPNKGTLGLAIDGRGGAEMIVVGGQDGQSAFIDTIEVFNFRSLKWTSSSNLDKSYGAYRSIAAPILDLLPSEIGHPSGHAQDQDPSADEEHESGTEHTSGSPLLIFSNYNFLNTKIELQVRHVDGTLTEKQIRNESKPPGLRFPNGGIINHHLIVSGTYITSSQQDYMIWALDLRQLVWHRVDVGGGTFGAGSWNRGVLWKKRNAFIILGSRNRRLGDDYNARRLNFSDMCILELEAFGLYENPKRTIFSDRKPSVGGTVGSDGADITFDTRSGENSHTPEILGLIGLRSRELCDMEILARDGEIIPVNSQVLRLRWGPYFQHLMQEDNTRPDNASGSTTLAGSAISDVHRNRSSISTVTPSSNATLSNGATQTAASQGGPRRPSSVMSSGTAINLTKQSTTAITSSRHRVLYLPHTFLTIQALLHYLYTSSLPMLDKEICTPQVLCSLLQIARPYHVQGLLEATVERLHEVLNARNTAAIFNAAAMAAGGGETIRFTGDLANLEGLAMSESSNTKSFGNGNTTREGAASQHTMIEDESEDATSSASASTASISDIEDTVNEMETEIWRGNISAVIGLQKRGLRGLMEGRRLRELGRFEDTGGASTTSMQASGGSGLGIA